MPTFSTRARAKGMLGIPAGITMHDEVIDTYLDVADQVVLDELGLTSAAVTTYSEKFDIGRGGQKDIALTYRPLVSVTALTDNGQLVASSGYYTTKDGQVRLSNMDSFFTVGRQTVEITYTSGWSSIPSDLSHAATTIVASFFNSSSHLGLAREQIGQYGYGLAGQGEGIGIPRIANRILGKYRRVFVKEPGH